jgi:uncharacterized protein YndB with AHSA1/START domain
MPVIRQAMTIEAPPRAVWDLLIDIPRQPEWMHDLKSITDASDGPVGVGWQATGTIRMFGISQSDPVEVTAFEPPLRFALSHRGRFAGGATFVLTPVRGGGATRCDWTEDVRFDPSTVRLPGRLGASRSLSRVAQGVAGVAGAVMDPLLVLPFRFVFRRDLRRLRRLVETQATDRARRDAVTEPLRAEQAPEVPAEGSEA